MIDFSSLKKLPNKSVATNKSLGAINLRISNKHLLTMIRDIQKVLGDRVAPQTIIESMIAHTHKQLTKEGKI